MSSSSPPEDALPDDADFDEVFDVDKIVAESFRAVAAEHAHITSPCTHYLVKWAGFPTTLGSWTPAIMCSKGLIDSFKSGTRSRITVSPDAVTTPISSAPVSFTNTIPSAVAVTIPISISAPVSTTSVALVPGGSTIEELKLSAAQLNADCNVRIRGRDRRNGPQGLFYVYRVGCRHVTGLLPCSLSLTCDVHEGVVSNVRRYTTGTCASTICDNCSCRLTNELCIYDGCHRFCKTCLSVMVISEVQGESLPLFVRTREIRCGYCKEPLNLALVSPLMNQDATFAYQNALCTIASLESEKITETRLRASTSTAASPAQLDPVAVFLREVEGLILPFCPKCKRILPDFDGCCALQCGSVAGTYVKEIGCGAHVCAWCQNDFLDAFACHRHVMECIHNPTGAFYLIS